MKRRPEPELMDDEAQALAYAEADFDAPHTLFIDLFRQRCTSLPGQRVLDLGCGPGDIVRRFAQAFPQSHIDAVDGSAPMLAHAQTMLSDSGLEKRVQLIHAYLPTDKLASASYDLVISNSLLHHLNDPMTIWQSILRYSRKGSFVFVMDLMRPQSDIVAQALVDEYAKDEPEILRHDFYHSLLAAYSLDEVGLQLKSAGLKQLNLEPVSDRHFIVSGFL